MVGNCIWVNPFHGWTAIVASPSFLVQHWVTVEGSHWVIYVLLGLGSVSIVGLLVLNFLQQQRAAQKTIAALRQQIQDLTTQIETITQNDQARQQDLLLASITARIRRSLDIQDILQTSVEEIHRWLGVERVHVTQLDEQGYSFVAAEIVSPGYAPIREVRYPPDLVKKLQIWYKQIRVTADTSIVYQDPDLSQFVSEYRTQYQVQASITVPLGIPGDAPFGLLSVHQCSRHRNWQDCEIDLLTKIALQMEVAIQQGKLYEQVRNLAKTLEQQVQERTLQLQEKMEELQQSNQLKERLLHAVAHDLHTPILGSLMVFKRLVQKQGSSIEVSRQVIELVLDSTQRQLDLIRSLANEEEEIIATQELNPTPIDVPHLIQTTLQRLSPLIRDNQTQVQVSIASHLPPIQADSLCIQRVLEQLIDNAIRHNPPGTEVSVITEGIHLPHADDSDKPDSEDANAASIFLNCEVRDNGQGLTPKQLANLFTKPYLRSSNSRRLTGMGMGLYLCHQMIQAHGGTIAATANSPHGLIISFRLPLCSSSKALADRQMVKAS
jgi:signal transduction histidine kinase